MRRTSARGILFGLFSVLAMVAVVGCSSNSGGTNSTQAPIIVPKGSILLTGRIKPVSTTLTPGTATPDGVTLTVDEAAISTDGKSYETIVTGPVGADLDSQMSPIIVDKGDLHTGIYKSIKLSVSKMDWYSNWTFANPSPCNGNTSGSASGSLDLSARPDLYFKTADLGGNTAAYYQSNPPLSGYAGDADHPLILPAPVQVLQDETTTVSLVLGTDYTLGCSHISAFGSTDNGDVAPLQQIVGSGSGLSGSSGLIVDADRNQLVATNDIGNSLTIYSLSGVGANNSEPLRSITGPGTRLNGPVAATLFSAGQAGGSGDEYVVLNRDNDSIATYSVSDSDNATPLRTIWGLFTGLSKPTGLAFNLDPYGDGDPAKDEILVANSGNDSVTSYTRLANGDTFPLVTLEGPSTGLNGACGIGIDKQHQEVFVTNSNSNTITVYDLQDLDGSQKLLDPNTGGILTSPHIDISPLLTISSSSTHLAEPCGIVVDSGNAEIYVANKGNDSISVFAVDAPLQTAIQDPNTTDVTVAAVRSIAGTGTGLSEPAGIQLSGGQLWVAHNGGQAVMAQTPQIIPAISNESATANSVLDGDYNVVRFGIDLHQGINGFGSKIPVLHAERGIASFNLQAPNWPGFTFQRDSGIKQFKRQMIEPGCGQPDLNVKVGFFGVASDNSFYAFTSDNQGIINGSFLPNGEGFTGVSYNGDEMYVVYGTKSTGSSIPYLSDNGTDTGNPAFYAYVNYFNYFQSISRFLDPPKSDQFGYRLEVGYIYTQPDSFLTLFADTNIVSGFDPMGDYKVPSTSAPRSSTYFRINARGTSPSTMHAGGFVENPGYGIAGAVSKDSQSLIFVNDITSVDANDCQTTAGIGVGLRQRVAGTFKTQDINGTYYIAGIGDDYQSPVARDKYFSMSGTISFDGGGSATMVQTENSEGEIKSSNNTFSYQVISSPVPSSRTVGVGPDNISMDVLKLYSSESATTPYATALIGMDGKILTFYQTGTTRLLGFGLLQKQ